MSKNLLKYPYDWVVKDSHNNIIQSNIFTDLGDGRIKINGALEGTNVQSDNIVLYLYRNDDWLDPGEESNNYSFPQGEYILSIEVQGGTVRKKSGVSAGQGGTVFLSVSYNEDNDDQHAILNYYDSNYSETYYESEPISVNDGIQTITFYISVFEEYDNVIIAPMLRDASIENHTWVAYGDGSNNSNNPSGEVIDPSTPDPEPEPEIKKITVISDITLDLRKTNIQSIKAKQYDDKSRYIKIDVVDNGEHIDLNGFDVNYKMLTSDDRALYDSCTIDEDGYAYIELTDNILYKGGKANCELVITGDENIISTMPFILQITPSVFQDDKIIAPDSFSVMNKIAELERTKADKTEIPTKVSELENDAEYITLEDIDIEVDPILETGVEIAQISVNGETAVLYAPQGGGGGGTDDYSLLSNKPQINGVVLSGNKTSEQLGLVAAETGKGLSSNDYTNAEKNKLNSIESGAEVNVQSDWNETDTTSDAYIRNKPDYDTDIGDLKSTVYGGKRNLIPYPYTQDSVTTNGVTITDNGDGSVTVSGKITNVSGQTPTLRTSNFTLSAGEYIFSCENVNPVGQGSEYIYAPVFLYLASNDSIKKRVLGLTTPVNYKDGHPYYDDNLRLESHLSHLVLNEDTLVYITFEISPTNNVLNYNWNNQVFQFMLRDYNEESIKWYPPGTQDSLSDKIDNKEQVHELVTATLSTSNWVTSGSTHKYSLESLYPASDYIIEQMQPIDSLTSLEDWSKAKILGNNDTSENYITAYGDKPTNNISVMFYIKGK